MTHSPRDLFLMMSPAAQEEAVALARIQGVSFDLLECSWRGWRARPEQLVDPEWPEFIVAFVTGRGFGKTISGANWVHEEAAKRPNGRGALVHRTAADVRDVMIEGETGILNTAPPGVKVRYEPSKRRLTWGNKFTMTAFSAEEPDQLRGPNFEIAWSDEWTSWRYLKGLDGTTALDNLLFATRTKRQGRQPRVVLTTTPKRVPAMRELELDKRVRWIRGSMRDNMHNLAPEFVNMILAKYAGTPLGQQEIEGILAKTVEGAIFTERLFEATRVTQLEQLPSLDRPVVSVDPSVGDGSGDECGICVSALSAGPMPTEFVHNGITVVREVRHGYILDDASVSGPPDVWVARVSDIASKHDTTTIIAEANQGGKLVESAIRAYNPALRVQLVHASQGKEARAQPLSALFAQGRWHVVGYLPEFEDQCTTWIPGTGKSPDRLDAAVWGQAYLEPSMGYEIVQATTPVDLQVARMARVAGRRQW